MYFFVAISGYLALAIVNILDKLILTKAVPKPIMFVFYSCVFVLPILLLIPFGVIFLQGWLDWAIAFISGTAFALALWFMYISYQQSEISHAGPLVGAITPFFVVVLSLLLLRENLTIFQLAGIFVLIVGSCLIAIEKKGRGHNFWHIGILWGALAGLFFAVSHVSAKYIYDIYGFYSGFVWTRVGLALCAVFLLFLPVVRRALTERKVNRQMQIRPKARQQMILVAFDKGLAVLALILIQYASAVGSVSLVNALAGVQFAVLIILVAVLSKFASRLFKEQYQRGEFASEVIAVFIIAIGLALVLI